MDVSCVILRKAAVIFPKSITRLIVVLGIQTVFYEVETEFKNIYTNFMLQRANGMH